MPRRLVLLVFLLPLAGCGNLTERNVEEQVDRDISRPLAAFCCDRIDSPTARATCVSSAEATCGFAVGGHSKVTKIELHDGGDVAFADVTITGPKGTGHGWIQLQRGGSRWSIVEARYSTP